MPEGYNAFVLHYNYIWIESLSSFPCPQLNIGAALLWTESSADVSVTYSSKDLVFIEIIFRSPIPPAVFQ